MGFFDALRRVLTGARPAVAPAPSDWNPVGGLAGDKHLSDAPTPGPDVYDRVQWHKKLKRILDELPASQAEWPVLMTEARALGFDTTWLQECQLEEFQLMIRQAVSDRHVTEEEHRKLDLARDLIGIPEVEAEAMLDAIVAEAEAFFGKPVEEL
jgi:hypothetical protein